MTVKPTDHVVRLIELKAKDGFVLEAKLDGRRVAKQYEAALRSLGQFGGDPDAVETAERYRRLLGRLRAIEDMP